MCRLICAFGEFEAAAIADAAVAMAHGATATHGHSVTTHLDGWGALWRDTDAEFSLRVHRNPDSDTAESLAGAHFISRPTNFMVVHVRHATFAEKRGHEFTHPVVTSNGDKQLWYLFHQGYLPEVAKRLGMDESHFDSREYLEFIRPTSGTRLCGASILEKLDKLGPGNTSGNAVLLNRFRAYLIHWFADDVPDVDFYTMRAFRTPTATIISSEAIPAIAPPDQWTELAPRQVIEIDLNRPAGSVLLNG